MKGPKYKISVVIPVYNCADLLEASITSALRQRGCDTEVIIVDDASSDDIESVVSLFKSNKRVRYFKLLKNQGPSFARNTAIKFAKHDWIVILDADDTIDSLRSLKLIEVAVKLDLDIVLDDQIMYSRTMEGISCLASRSESIPLIRNLSEFNYIDLDCLISNPQLGILQPVFKRSCLTRVAKIYNENYRYGEDYDLLVRLVAVGCRLGYIPEAYYHVNIREFSLTADRKKMFEGMIEVYRSLLKNSEVPLEMEQESALINNIRLASRTIAYAELSNSLKKKLFFQSLKCFITYPNLALQIPKRLPGLIVKSVKVYGKRWIS
ncbi:glycosyltransferase [Billgrantia kenyensis]|uniref:Glycosyltransferase family 2 protein n=1 Tax=Billgrantia kenyensis TaxID=321266 RepID=A0A7W0AF92_9GAMM|nr:glycosyltransferase family 2 protein [Halomonas kenyensis]MCG6663843.1 glycosyltransferase family 2 protein [Halomonas kenyensis]